MSIINRLRNYLMRVRLWIVGREIFIKKEVSIPFTEYGTVYGAWGVIDDSLDENSVVYSFGVGTDISFDQSLIKKYALTIHAFDPTPRSIEWVKQQNVSDKFKLHDYGLSNSTGTLKLYYPDNSEYISLSVVKKINNNSIELSVKCLKDIMDELGHERLDLLKMDIEGSEYDVIDDLSKFAYLPKQLLIEFHHRFKNIGVKKTKHALKELHSLGYKIFYVSSRGHEVGFVLK